MENQYLNLMQFFEGYVRNYRKMSLTQVHNRSMITKREIDYFTTLGEMLGFEAFIEDSKMDKSKGRSRPMDLSWWKLDSREDTDYYLYLALHLERENVWDKGVETIEKLFSETEDGYLPHNVIGIQSIGSQERIKSLNDLVVQKNSIQQSNVLMMYHLYDAEIEAYRVYAYFTTAAGVTELRKAIRKADALGYWFMCFEEEYEGLRGSFLRNP